MWAVGTCKAPLILGSKSKFQDQYGRFEIKYTGWQEVRYTGLQVESKKKK